MLEATLRLLLDQPTCTIPTDNRALVEQATHPEALDEIAGERGPDWEAFGIEVEGTLRASATLARLHALPYSEPYDELNFPADEERIATRLGAADRLLEFDPQPMGPFGIPVKHLSLRHHQVPAGVKPEAQPENIAALVDGGFTFAFGGAPFRYTRFGLERDTVIVSSSNL
jgi:CRISPR-associated endonuclease/helicase Cas3